jgi:hypothetical protein
MLGSVRSLRRGILGSRSRDRIPRLHRYTAISTRAPSPNSTQRKSHMANRHYIAASLTASSISTATMRDTPGSCIVTPES